MGTTVFRIRMGMIFRWCGNPITPSRVPNVGSFRRRFMEFDGTEFPRADCPISPNGPGIAVTESFALPPAPRCPRGDQNPYCST
jgi:hypothetical protein